MTDVRMTYRQLKAALDALTEEQLEQPVIWSGDERGGEVRHVWIADEDWIGEDSDSETWLPRSQGLRLDPESYVEADVCIPRGTVHLIVDGGVAPPRRYFVLDTGGATYSFVARDVNHCMELLKGHEHDEIQTWKCTWTEITFEQAMLKMTRDEEQEPASPLYRLPLAHREVGAWFCSEY